MHARRDEILAGCDLLLESMDEFRERLTDTTAALLDGDEMPEGFVSDLDALTVAAALLRKEIKPGADVLRFPALALARFEDDHDDPGRAA